MHTRKYRHDWKGQPVLCAGWTIHPISCERCLSREEQEKIAIKKRLAENRSHEWCDEQHRCDSEIAWLTDQTLRTRFSGAISFSTFLTAICLQGIFFNKCASSRDQILLPFLLKPNFHHTHQKFDWWTEPSMEAPDGNARRSISAPSVGESANARDIR